MSLQCKSKTVITNSNNSGINWQTSPYLLLQFKFSILKKDDDDDDDQLLLRNG